MKLSISIITVLLLSTALPGLSQETTEGSDLPMLQTRSQLQDQLRTMSAEDRALYQQLNGDAEKGARKNGKGNGKGQGNGNHQRKRDGSGQGAQNRQRSETRERSSFGSGYGAGYGSRQGGGYGRR